MYNSIDTQSLRMTSTHSYNFPEGWSFEKLNPKKEYHLRAGTYYIGDICYISEESIYQDIYDKTNYESGFFTLKNKGSFLVASTAYGDGGFRDSFGNSYGVDAGNIGILNIQLLG